MREFQLVYYDYTPNRILRILHNILFVSILEGESWESKNVSLSILLEKKNTP